MARGSGGAAAARVRAVAFDLMDTVLTDPFREALTAAAGSSLEEVRARRDPAVYPAFERGELTEAQFWQHHRDVGLEVDPAAFHRIRRQRTRFLPGMAELLDELAGRVVRATASNYPIWIEELADGVLDGRFEFVLASHHLGARKPDPGFYRRLLQRLGLGPDEVLFVDDRAVNVEGAREVGLAAHRFVDVVELRVWLGQQGVSLG